MSRIKIYLDNCCFNRPFDDQSQVRIRIETEAKLHIQQQIESGDLLLVWSYILDYENTANPYEFRKTSINKWKNKANQYVNESEQVLEKANKLKAYGIKAKDALHIACAIESNCGYFLTTDDEITNKADMIQEITVLNPVDILKIIEA